MGDPKMEKKISECINVRINVGNYQHIDISKYAEKTISYSDNEDMVHQEDQLTQELLDNLIRNMRTIPERLGKKTDPVPPFEDSIKKAIPEWLANGPVPNIANGAAKSHQTNLADQQAVKDSVIKVEGVSDEDIFATSTEQVTGTPSPAKVPAEATMQEIIPPATPPVPEKKVEGDLAEIFGDDEDLFK
jgi:hypothetical protein